MNPIVNWVVIIAAFIIIIAAGVWFVNAIDDDADALGVLNAYLSTRIA